MTGRWKAIAARGLEVAAIAAICVLVWSNYTLRARVRRAQHAHAEAPLRAFAVGDRLERVQAVRPDGSPQNVDLRARRTVVAVLNPSCGTCQAALAQLGNTSRIASVVFASRDSEAGLADLAARFGLRERVFSISTAASPQFRERFVINPQIFVVDRGKVVRTCDSVAECAAGP